MRFTSKLLAFFLTPVLAIGPVHAQVPGTDFQVQVLESDGAQVQAGSSSVKGYTIEVADSSGAPVAEAAVVVRLPESTPSGHFADGSHSGITYTDTSGHAHISGIRWDDSPGVISVKITASKGSVHAGTLYSQSLVSGMAKAAVPDARSVSAVVSPPDPVTPSRVITPRSEKASEAARSTPAVPSPSLSESPAEPGRLETAALLPSHVAPSQMSPYVSVTATPKGEKVHSGSGKTKWIVLAAVAAGAGIGVAMMGHGKASTPAAATTTGVSIGSPTVSIGAP
jgi:hypothetical protein